MGCREYELAAQYAASMCDCVGAPAREAGLICGRVTAVRHDAKVSDLKLAVYGRQAPDAGCGSLHAPCRFAGVAELYDLFYPTVCDGLQHCAVRFGRIKYFFLRGVLHEVTVTETFRIPREIPYLSRVFLPWFDSVPSSFYSGVAFEAGHQLKPK